MTKIDKPRKRPRIGDVIEIATVNGAAFAQYIHRHREFGDMVRVLGIADSESGPDEVAVRPTQFVTFFPLGAACRRGTARILGPASIPESLRQFPSFRQALRLDPRSKEPCRWLLWSGGEELIVAELTADQRSWPIRAIMNDTMLVERALAGWTAEQQQ